MKLKGAQIGQLGFGAGVVLMGVLVAFLTASIPIGPSYSAVGPRIFPVLIAGALLLVGVAMVVETLTTVASDEKIEFEWQSLAWISAGLIAQLALIKPAGFVIASTVLFVAVARAFGGRRIVVEIVSGLVLCSAAYIGFTWGLGLNLPAGFLAGLW